MGEAVALTMEDTEVSRELPGDTDRLPGRHQDFACFNIGHYAPFALFITSRDRVVRRLCLRDWAYVT